MAEKLDEYCDWGDTTYSVGFGSQQEWLFQYYDELHLVESIESAYLKWKLEQHILTPKYDILGSLVPLVKHYNVALEKNDNQFKITCQFCNGFVTCSGISRELIYILPLSMLKCILLEYTLKILFHKISTFSGLPEPKFHAYIRDF